MTYAACDDCPRDAWHLHVTVQPHWSWSFADTAAALRRDGERHGIRPVVVTNHFRNNARPSYKELIPTKHVHGSEANASREIFHMGVLLNNAGWRVKRLKIEGDPKAVAPGRALYFEAHIKNPVASCNLLPRSSNAKGENIYTVRHDDQMTVRLTLGVVLCSDARIEACVLDTAPELDSEWINQ